MDVLVNQKTKTWIVALLLALGVMLLGSIMRLGVFEDAYITFRCAQNFAADHGLVYNPGQKIEATTNFLYAILIGLAMKAHLNPAHVARVLNHLALFFIFYLLAGFVLVKQPTKYARLPIIGLLLPALHPSIWVYAHSGMETVFYTALLFGGFILLVKHLENGRSPAFAALLFAVAAMVRMEAIAFAGLATLLVLVAGQRRKRLRHALLLAIAFWAFYAPVLAWRWSYYGYPFPNTYYAKVDGGSLILAFRGLMYSLRWFVANPLAVLAVLLGVKIFLSGREIRLRSTLGLAWIFGFVAVVAFEGGDYFSFGRFFVPLIPVIGWVLADQLPRVVDLWPKRGPVLADWLNRYLIAILLIGMFWLLLTPKGLFYYYFQMRTVTEWKKIGVSMSERLPLDLTLYVTTAGAIPYFSGLTTYDSLGITDRVTAHMDTRLGKGLIGHQKSNIARIKSGEARPDLRQFLSAGHRHGRPARPMPALCILQTVAHPPATEGRRTSRFEKIACVQSLSDAINKLQRNQKVRLHAIERPLPVDSVSGEKTSESKGARYSRSHRLSLTRTPSRLPSDFVKA